MKFAHISDTHVKLYKYHEEYREIFDKIFLTLQEEKVDAIIHTGDLNHSKIQISPEQIDLVVFFLRNLAKIAPVYLIKGNHDGLIRNKNRRDAISPIVDAIQEPNIHFLDKSGEVQFDNKIILNVLDVFDKDNWIKPTDPSKINIALHHGSISGCETDIGHQLTYGENDISIFDGFDFAFLGDIHKTNQVMDREGRIRYPGSTVQQNHGETNDKGFLIWDIKSKDDFSVKHITLPNPKPFVSIVLTKKGQIPRRLPDIPAGARLRVIAENNLSLDRIRKALEVAKKRFKPEIVTYLNRSDSRANSIEALMGDFKKEDLRDIAVQERLIREYLKDFHPDDDTLERVFELNRRYDAMVTRGDEVIRNVHFEILDLEWDNLFKYGEGNRVMFSGLDGIVGIFGKNFIGKSSIIDTLCYVLYNSTTKDVTKNLRLINHEKDTCSAKIKIRLGHKIFTILRSSEKYTKKLRSRETLEARTFVDFSVFDEVTGDETSLNGETRAATDRTIARYFGTLDDFLLTSMSSQQDAQAFIKEKSTKRKEILGRFLDIAFFTKKHNLANDDAKEQRGVLKKLENRNFNEEIGQALLALEGNERDKKEKEAKCKKLAAQESALEEKIELLQDQIDEAPTEFIDIEAVNKELVEKQAAFVECKLQKNQAKANEKKYITEQEAIKKALENFDVKKLHKTADDAEHILDEIDHLGNQLATLSESSERYQEAANSLKQIPCGDEYPGCPFIKAAQPAAKKLGEINKLREVKQADLNIADADLIEIDYQKVKKELEEAAALDARYIELEQFIVGSRLLIESGKAKIRNLEHDIEDLSETRETYEKYRDVIEDLAAVKRDKRESDNKLLGVQRDLRACNQDLLELYKDHGSFEQKLNQLLKSREELRQTREEFEAFDLYLKCMHPSGIAYDIIKKSLPAINVELAKILTNIIEFQVFFVNEDNRLDIYIQRPKDVEPTLIELCSGAEKTITAMAIRLAFISISTIPHGDIFILDEPGTSLDAESMEEFIRILELTKSFFKCVLLISHLETLKDTTDSLIDVQRKGCFSYVDA